MKKRGGTWGGVGSSTQRLLRGVQVSLHVNGGFASYREMRKGFLKSCCYNKMPSKGILRMEKPILAHGFREHPTMVDYRSNSN